MTFSIAYTFSRETNELHLYKVETHLNFHIVNMEHLPSKLLHQNSVVYHFDKADTIPITELIKFVSGASNLPSIFTIQTMYEFLYGMYIASTIIDRPPLKQIQMLENLNRFNANVFLTSVFIPLTSLPKPNLVYSINSSHGITYKLLYNEHAVDLTLDRLTLDMLSESYYRNLPNNPVILEIPLGTNSTLLTTDDLKDKILSTTALRHHEINLVVNLLSNESLPLYASFIRWIWAEQEQLALLSSNIDERSYTDGISLFLKNKLTTIENETQDTLASLLN